MYSTLTGDGVDFTSFFCSSAFFSGLTDEDDLSFVADVDALTEVDGSDVFFSIDDAETECLDSSASLDAALTAAAPGSQV